jgi:hypothetical protein
MSHAELTVTTWHDWLKEGSDQGHTSRDTHISHVLLLERVRSQGLSNHFPLQTLVLTGA